MDDMAEFRNRVRRGPWTGGDLNDVFAARSAIATEPSGIAQDIGFTPAQASRVQTGLSNHNFRDAPPDTTLNIADITNKLPDWSFVQSSGTAITAKWVADSGSGSGGIIRFDVASGAAGDFSYIEQVVSVASSRVQTWVQVLGATFRNRSASRSFVVWGEVQALKDDGTTTGTPTVFSTAWSSATYTDEQLASVTSTGYLPTDAQDLRIRIGVKRDAALTSDTGTIDLAETRLIRGQSYVIAADQASLTSGSLPALFTKRDSIAYIMSAVAPQNMQSSTAGGEVHRIEFPIDNGARGFGTYVGEYSVRGSLVTNGWAARAFPQGIGPSTVSTSSTTLTNQNDAMIVPISVDSFMRVRSVTLRQGIADGTQRSFKWYLAVQTDFNSATLRLIGNGNSGNYTAGAVSNETVATSAAIGHIEIPPGTYWLVIQNTHATRSHVTRVLGGGDWTPNTGATSTTVGSLSSASTFSASTFTTKITGIPMVRLNGDVLGEGAAF